MKSESLNKSICFVFILTALTGCTTLTSPARNHSLTENNRVYWFDYAAERRGGFLIPKPSSGSPTAYSICAEPAPDVALKHTSDLAASAKLPNTVDAEIKAKFANDVIQLAGRTQTILFLREAMYRLCEQGINGNLTPGEVKILYTSVINAAVEFAEATKVREIGNALESTKDPATQKLILDKLSK